MAQIMQRTFAGAGLNPLNAGINLFDTNRFGLHEEWVRMAMRHMNIKRSKESFFTLAS
jgi:hypothetical protein